MGSDYIVSDFLLISIRSSAPLGWSFENYLWPWKASFSGTDVLGENCCLHSLWGPRLTFLPQNKWFPTICADQDCWAWNIPLHLVSPASHRPQGVWVTRGMKSGALGQWRLVLHELSPSSSVSSWGMVWAAPTQENMFDTFVGANISQRRIQGPLSSLLYLVYLFGTSHLSAPAARAWRMKVFLFYLSGVMFSCQLP